MKIWEAVLLGLIQGASEFLPISSSGHLLLLEKLGIGEEDLFFNICLHLGTLIAVLIALKDEWLPLVKKPFQKKTAHLVVACLPTVALAIVFKYLFPSLIDGVFLGFGFILTACLLFSCERIHFAQSPFLDFKKSILTGVLQGIAVLPGVSRSGATIAALTYCGIPKTEAASFSFLLSIPIIIGSALYEGIELAVTKTPLSVPVIPTLIGTTFAFVSGLIAIKFFLKLIRNKSMLPFAVYTLILGISVTILPLLIDC